MKIRIGFKSRLQWHYIWRRIKLLFAKDKYGVYPIGKTTHIHPTISEIQLVQYGYTYNYFSYQYRKCIIDMRKLYLTDYGEVRQIHVRVFDDKTVTAHDEYAYEWDALAHMKAIGLKQLSVKEILHLKDVLRLDPVYLLK